MPEADIVLAGCGAVTAVGRGVAALRAAVQANASGLRSAPPFEQPRFQSGVVGVALEPDPERDNPAYTLVSPALLEARHEAKDLLDGIDPQRIGLVLSTTKANLEALERITDVRACSEAARRHLQGDLLALDLAKEHGAGGPVQCVSVACVSGLIALQQGARLIRRGAADAVLVAGVDHLSAFVMAGFSALKALDPEGCRPFDRNRCGLSPGEAGAAIVLARADTGSGRGFVMRGWASTNDANHMTGPSRDGSGMAQAIQAALKISGVSKGKIDYVNAHGTGTIYNDAMESLALRSVFGKDCPPVSGSKGMLGHTLGAAGVVESILCKIALEDKILPGTPRLGTAGEGFPESLLPRPIMGRSVRTVLKLNSGFGGINGAIVYSHV